MRDFGHRCETGGSEPVKTATVQLQSLQDLAHTVSVVTDMSGRFELRGIDPGRYRLKVSHLGLSLKNMARGHQMILGRNSPLGGQDLRDLLFG